MARRPPTPAEIARGQMRDLAAATRKLLVDNPNMRRGDGGGEAYHARRHPRTADFLAHELPNLAGHVLERIERATEVVVAMAAEAEVPGLTKRYSGFVRDREVTLVEERDGTWAVSFDIPNAFHGDDDVSVKAADEAAALALARAFVETGALPEPAPAEAPAPSGP